MVTCTLLLKLFVCEIWKEASRAMFYEISSYFCPKLQSFKLGKKGRYSLWFDFKESYVAFLDILGFKDILKAEDFKKQIENCFNIIDLAIKKSTEKSLHKIYPKEDIETTILSDSIILSIDISNQLEKSDKLKSLRFLLSAVEKIQYYLSLEDIWIRGAISQGELSHANYNVIGQGLVDAYLLESKAVFPRVLIDSKIFRTIFSENGEPILINRHDILSEINLDWNNTKYSGKFIFDWSTSANLNYFKQDYPFFIHFLNSILAEDKKSEREKIVKLLAKNLIGADPEIYKKHKWVSDYLRASIEGEINRLEKLTKNWAETDDEYEKRKGHKSLSQCLRYLTNL